MRSRPYRPSSAASGSAANFAVSRSIGTAQSRSPFSAARTMVLPDTAIPLGDASEVAHVTSGLTYFGLVLVPSTTGQP